MLPVVPWTIVSLRDLRGVAVGSCEHERQLLNPGRHGWHENLSMSTHKIAALVIALMTVSAVASADVRLPGIISDHMVVQRGAPVRILGAAQPGETVSVAFRGQKVNATTDALGRWEVWLDPLMPGPAEDMTISGTNTLVVADVLVGDVWVGSGQSNMQWMVRQADNAEAETAAATFPEIRLFQVPRNTSPFPQADVEAKWVVCSPQSVPEFSAVLYYFGREMHRDLIGLPASLFRTDENDEPVR